MLVKAIYCERMKCKGTLILSLIHISEPTRP